MKTEVLGFVYKLLQDFCGFSSRVSCRIPAEVHFVLIHKFVLGFLLTASAADFPTGYPSRVLAENLTKFQSENPPCVSSGKPLKVSSKNL